VEEAELKRERRRRRKLKGFEEVRLPREQPSGEMSSQDY